MASISAPIATIGSAVLGAGTSLLGGSTASSSASDAANLQAQQQQQTVANLAPYNTVGQSAAGQLSNLNTTGFTAGQPNYLANAAASQPGANTEANLVNTPGYQFNLQQGTEATQNSAAARGLGVSGAAMKGAATYATGLADSTYQNQFNNQQTQFQNDLNLNTGQQTNATNLYNRLYGTASLGENAAATTGSTGQAAAAAGGNYLAQSGQYNAAGITGAGNAVANGTQNYLTQTALSNLTGTSTGGGTPGYNNLSGTGYNAPSNSGTNALSPGMYNF